MSGNTGKKSKKSKKKGESSELEQLLTCPVCSDVYRDPVILPCHHTLCKRCLDCLKQANNFYMCPTCKSLADARKIKRDSRMRSLLELRMLDTVGAVTSAEEGGKAKMMTSCEVCHRNVIEWRCVECAQFLCHECKSNHGAIQVCREHTFESLQRCATEKKEKLEEAAARLKMVEKDCLDRREELFAKASRLHQQKTSVLTQIMASKKEQVRRVKEHHAELCQRAINLWNEEERNLHSLSAMIDSTLDGIRHKSSVLDNLLLGNDYASLLKCADDICEKVGKIDLTDLSPSDLQSELRVQLKVKDFDVSETVKLSLKKKNQKQVTIDTNGNPESLPSPRRSTSPSSPRRVDVIMTSPRAESRERRGRSRSPKRENINNTETPKERREPRFDEHRRRSRSPEAVKTARHVKPIRSHSEPREARNGSRHRSKSREREDAHRRLRSPSPVRSPRVVRTSRSRSPEVARRSGSGARLERRNSNSRIPLNTTKHSSSIRGTNTEAANRSHLRMTPVTSQTVKFLPEPSLPTELTSHVRLQQDEQFEVNVNAQQLRTFVVIEREVWCVYMDVIERYDDTSGKLLSKHKHHNMVDARGVTRTHNDNIVVACGSSCGLLQFENKSALDKVIGKSPGSFCDVTADQTYLYGLDYRETKVIVFKHCYRKWMLVRRVGLAYWNGSARDTMLVHDDNMFVCSYTNAEIYQYDLFGTLLGQFNQMTGQLTTTHP